MDDKEKEKNLLKFVKKNENSLNKIPKTFVELFNKIGKDDETGQMQNALTVLIISVLLKTTNMPVKTKHNILKKVKGKIAN